MRYRNNGQIEEELQIRFTGYLIQAVKRTRRDYLNMLNQYSNSEILTDTTYTPGQTLEQEVTERLPLWDVIESTLGMELAFPLLTLTAAPGLLHIGEQEDQHDPKPPEGKYPYQKPRLPGSAYQSHDGDDSTDQDCDAAAQKSFVVTHVVTVLPFKFCLKTKKGTAPSFSSF